MPYVIQIVVSRLVGGMGPQNGKTVNFADMLNRQGEGLTRVTN